MAGLPTGKIRDGLCLDIDNPRQTVNTYDKTGRITETVLLSEGTVKWRTITSYHGDRTDVTPPNGGTASSTLTDARGRTTAIREYHSPTPSGTYDETKLHYNPIGSLDNVIDASGNPWTYEYDIRGRKTASGDPDSGRSTTAYNAKDQIERTTDADNHILAYTYDALGRKTSARDASTSGPVRTAWAYDSPYKGALTGSTRYDGGLAYTNTLVTVDAEYRPTQVRVDIPARDGDPAGSFATRYSYRADGSPNTVVLPAAGDLAAETLTYVYDSTYAQPVALKTSYAGAAYYVNQATYTNLYEPSSVTRSTQLTGAGFVSTSQTYEQATTRVVGRQTIRSVGQAVVTNATIKYDEAGHIQWIDDNAANGRDYQCFDYDHLQRLTQAWTPQTNNCDAELTSAAQLGGPAPYWQSWEFGTPDDPKGRVGNRLKQIDHTAAGNVATDYTYPEPKAARPHAATTVVRTDTKGSVTTGFSYDQSGNTTSRPGPAGQQTLSWNAEGRLAALTDEAGANSYLYDADGNRLIARDPAGTTLDLGDQQLRRSTGSSTATATRYYTFNGQLIGQRDNTGVRWLATDSQGTSNATITADAQQTVTQRRQNPYGESRGAAVSWVNPRGFLGGQQDPTGLTHLGAREYDPGLGKFISVDPIQDLSDPQQWNPYAYADNNPITYSDPSGLVLGCGGQTDIPCPKGGGGTHNGITGGGDKGGGTSGSGGSSSGSGGGPRRVGTMVYSSSGNSVVEALIKGPVDAVYEATIGYFENAVAQTNQTWDEMDAVSNGDMSLNDFLISYGKRAYQTGPTPVGLYNMGKAMYEDGKAAVTADSPVDRAYHASHLAVSLEMLFSGPKGAKGVRCSFIPTTLVLMADHTTKPIEDIELGDEVQATDPQTGDTSAESVTALFDDHDTEMTDLEVVDDSGNHSTIHATQSHPFWNATTSEWIPANRLTAGDRLFPAPTYVAVRVVKAINFTQPQRMLNLTVAEVHTYYVLVGATPVLVHNCGSTPPGVSCTCSPATGAGPNVSPIRVEGPWTLGDIGRGAHGLRPNHLGDRIEIHHADQMPGSPIHELDQVVHRGPGSQLHPNANNQGVSGPMRTEDTRLHWWYRSQEQGWGHYKPDLWHD